MNINAPRILVVDDEPDIRRLVCEILEDEGYQVAMAKNGLEARQLKISHRPNLILLDIWMPDTDGVSLLKEWVLEDELICPVVMMSGHGSVELAVEATRLGAYDFLEKPLSLAKLLLIVERAIEAGHLQIENAGLKKQLVSDHQTEANIPGLLIGKVRSYNLLKSSVCRYQKLIFQMKQKIYRNSKSLIQKVKYRFVGLF